MPVIICWIIQFPQVSFTEEINVESITYDTLYKTVQVNMQKLIWATE